jgi:hypothetical protein
MRDCTFAEMSSFGWAFQRIAKKGGPDNRVGDVLDEKQVADLIGKAAQ